MPSDSAKYFLGKALFNTGEIIGYFDFANTGNYGNYLVKSEDWTKSQGTLFIFNSGNFWDKSGFAHFNGSNYTQLNNAYDNISFLMTYELPNNRDNVFVSLFGQNNTLNFGISAGGFPYLEYNDSILGPIVQPYKTRVNNTGIVLFELTDSYCSIAALNGADYRLDRLINPLKATDGFIKPTGYYIGGSPSLPSNRFLSGYLQEVFIYKNDFIDYDSYERLFVSGLVTTISENTYSGYISGQTGRLEGDIIKITECFVNVENISSGFVISTGEDRYFATSQSFLDFNNEAYNIFYQNISTGIFSGFSFSGKNTTSYGEQFIASKYFQYDSGYAIQYSITNTLPIISKKYYLYNYIDRIILNYPIDSGDILSIYGSKDFLNQNSFNSDGLIYNSAYNEYVNETRNISNNFSGLYYNGQLQTQSTGYQTDIIRGDVYYRPSNDYFISGKIIYSDNFFERPSVGNNVFADFWPNNYFLQTGGLLSGSQINSINFNNKLVFLNGQLLNSGYDYSGSNRILMNIDTGYNIISTHDISQLNLAKKIIINSSGSVFDLSDVCIENTSMVWLNGVRLDSNQDYFEADRNNINKSFIENNGLLIYNN